MARVVHAIEKQSYEILRARGDTSALPPCTPAVVERVIHASAATSYLGDLVCAEADLAAAAAALRRGAPVVADSAMTAAGITAREAVCRGGSAGRGAHQGARHHPRGGGHPSGRQRGRS